MVNTPVLTLVSFPSRACFHSTALCGSQKIFIACLALVGCSLCVFWLAQQVSSLAKIFCQVAKWWLATSILGSFATSLPCGHLCHRAATSASLRFTFFILLISIAICGCWPKRAASVVFSVLQKKCCWCAAGRLILVAVVALARSNELVRSCGGENHPFDDCLSTFDCLSAGLSWFQAPAAARLSTGRARAWASSPRSS